jgi:ATP-dependent helicase/nuclease subunit B
MNLLLNQLHDIGAKGSRTRKRLVGPEISLARELIRSLGRSGAYAIGWEAANLRILAEEISCNGLSRRGFSPSSDIQIASLINQAIDAIAADNVSYHTLASHGKKPGFREVIRDAVLELRTMGVSSDQVHNGSQRTLTRATGAVLMKYEELLAAEKLLDPAGIFKLALDDFDNEARWILEGMIVIAPGIRMSGLRGEFVKKLIEHGAIVLSGDTPHGLSVPRRMSESLAAEVIRSQSTLSFLAESSNGAESVQENDLDIFAASTPYEEIREALRRAKNEGRRWDEIELIATDSDTYGIALDAICERLQMGMSSLRGVPLRRTRIGRCFSRWLDWIADGLPADMIRAALESEELMIPGESELTTARLSPLFRTLQIGWGRARYEKAIKELATNVAIRRLKLRDDEDSPEDEARKAAALADSACLHRLLTVLIEYTPSIPERGSLDEITTSVSALADAALQYTDLLRVRDDADRRTIEKLQNRLRDIVDSEEEETTFALALSALEDGVSDLRAWSSLSGSSGVLSSQGGKLFLTDIANAGVTGRPRTFVLGLDADSVSGSHHEDPVLPDSDRRAIDPDSLATSIERREEKRYTLYRALASLRGKITLSYATTSEDGRQRGPSHVLLQALRLIENNPSLGFRELRERILPPACAAPRRTAGVMDSRDGWLAAIGATAALSDGRAQITSAFTGLRAGLDAFNLRDGSNLCAHHGLIPLSAGRFDPRSSDRVLSPSSFELMGRCPLAWFYKYAAQIIPPHDPEFSVETWLNALDTGSLLHSVFEEFGRKYLDRQNELFSDDAEAELMIIVNREITEWKVRVPPPNDIIWNLESEKLRASAASFLKMERDHREHRPQSSWREFELAFGGDGQESWYTLSDGSTVRMRGRIDRVDNGGDGRITVIDYKTGKADRYWRKRGEPPFKGGRQLQPSIYAEVVETALGATVDRFEYWFPTPKGANQLVPYARTELAQARPIIEGLLEHVATGCFLPTTDESDCRFCDYVSICRVRDTAHGVASPLAQWAKTNQDQHPQYASMRARRAKDA